MATVVESRNDYAPNNSYVFPLSLYYPQKFLSNKVLVLDVDETMVHSFIKPDEVAAIEALNIWSDPNLLSLRKVCRFFTVENVARGLPPGSGMENNIILVFRPHLLEFLIFASSYFRAIIIWSAGQPKYVRAAIRHIFKDIPEPFAILDSEMCSKDKYGDVAKPLKFIYDNFPNLANATNTIIIDDRESNMAANPDNGILIPEYSPKPKLTSLTAEDDAFLKIRSWLESAEVKNCKDIRQVPKHDLFKLG